jgi:uncharacterized GH25 family protein
MGAHGHDFWVEPAAFRLKPGASVAVELKVGSGSDVKTVARSPKRILRLEAVGRGGTRPIEGDAGDDPVGRFEPGEQGGDHLLVYRSNHAFIELEAAAFERYLDHEGLASIVARRREAGESEAPGRESYARSCKALVTVGTSDGTFDRVLDLPLELVPVSDPRVSKGPLRFRLLFRGRPLSGARVDLMTTNDLTRSRASRTTGDGTVEFPAPEPGIYLLATTHMVRAVPPVKGDWESHWATFTFEVTPP